MLFYTVSKVFADTRQHQSLLLPPPRDRLHSSRSCGGRLAQPVPQVEARNRQIL